MKIYLVAGESSGDAHAADLIREIKNRYPHAEIRAMGGDKMLQQGASLAFHFKDFAIMGFTEVVKNFPKIRKHFQAVIKDIIDFQPDKIILVDFSGFNLRLAKKLYRKFEIHYYIAPKAWAWNKKRVYKIKRYCTSLLCILPFEVSFFRAFGINAHYVGNPSKHQVSLFHNNTKKANTENYIALLPGSRKQEIERILPTMLEAVRALDIKYKISKVPNIDYKVYSPFITSTEQIIEDNYQLLSHAKVALVTSGTATLETALLGIPQVVCYKASLLSYWIAKNLVDLKYISLVNLIMDQEIVSELIQDECTAQKIRLELQRLLDESPERNKMLKNYRLLEDELGEIIPPKKASDIIFNS